MLPRLIIVVYLFRYRVRIHEYVTYGSYLFFPSIFASSYS